MTDYIVRIAESARKHGISAGSITLDELGISQDEINVMIDDSYRAAGNEAYSQWREADPDCAREADKSRLQLSVSGSLHI